MGRVAAGAAAGATGSGVLQYQADVDAFQVTLVAGSHRALVQGGQFLQVTVQDGIGAAIGSGYSGWPVDFTSTATSAVVLIRSNSYDGPGAFTVQVQ